MFERLVCEAYDADLAWKVDELKPDDDGMLRSALHRLKRSRAATRKRCRRRDVDEMIVGIVLLRYGSST